MRQDRCQTGGGRVDIHDFGGVGMQHSDWQIARQ